MDWEGTEETVRHIEVQYQDGSHAFVDDHSLEGLIKTNRIWGFYRPSEKRWITIGIDAVRSWKGNYCGRERRKTGRIHEMIPLLLQQKSTDCVSE